WLFLGSIGSLFVDLGFLLGDRRSKEDHVQQRWEGFMVDIEGVPLKVWTENTFARIMSKWGELVFEEGKEESYDDSIDEVSNDDNRGLHRNKKLEGDSDDEVIPETVFDHDQGDSKNNGVVGIHSEDPFNIFDLLKKKKENDTAVEQSHKNFKYPACFIPKEVNKVISNSLDKEKEEENKGKRNCYKEELNSVVKKNSSLRTSKEDGEMWVLCVWDPRLFCKENSTIFDYFIDIKGEWVLNAKNGEVVIVGDIYEVRSQDERFGSTFNVQGAANFNLFIFLGGLVEVPLGGCSFTWVYKSATKMKGFDKFVEEFWSAPFPFVTNVMVSVLDKKKSVAIRGILVEGAWLDSPDMVKNEFLSHFKDLFNRPGIKVGGMMSRIKSWDEIVKKMLARLSKWKMKTLSIGERLTLLKSVLDLTYIKKQGIDLLGLIKKKVGNDEDTLFWEDVWKGRWVWSLEGSGVFSIGLVRRHIDDHMIPEVSSKTHWIKAVLIKVNIHAWKVRLDCLPTRFNLSRRGVDIQSILCPNRGTFEESSSCIFFSCYLAREIYGKIATWLDFSVSEFGSYEEWELRSMFEKQAGVERFDLIQTFHACKLEEGKSVSQYVLKLKGYVEQLECLGYVLQQNLSVGLILNGLTNDFTGFVRNYNMHNIGKTISELHALLIEYEKGLPEKAVTPQVMVIQVSRNNVLYFNAIPNNGIYEIDMSNHVSNVNSIYNVSNKRVKYNLDSTYLWHTRLAYISKKRIEKLQQDGLLKSTDDESFDQCVSCLSGKMTRKSFPHRPERATDVLGFIHTDVCGLLRHVSKQGASYFITFTDDYSRYGYIYLPKYKHELTPPYTPQHNGVSKRRNRTLLDMVQSMMSLTTLPLSFWDYALEAATRILNMVPTKKVDKTPYELWFGKFPNWSYLKLTPPYTPQHNGVSKRRNRTLLDMVQSMMSLTTLPLSFWDYALEAATRILNMVPTKKVDKTPYELWFGKFPNWSYLKVWGCETLVKRDTPDKLQQRSIKCIF
nr:retrotransposon protein, putative, Ty1-copia subclass [Tanacetum cinerariifolium]